MAQGKITSVKHSKGKTMPARKARTDSSITAKSMSALKHQSGALEKTVPQNGSKRVGTVHESVPVLVRNIDKDGLKAFTHLMEQLRADSGATLLFAHHLSPEHHKQLTELLALDSRKQADETIHRLQNELAASEKFVAQRSADLLRLDGFVSNVFASLDIPLILVGEDQRIIRWSRAAEEALHLSPESKDHKVAGVKSSVRIPGLQAMLSNVLATGSHLEQEVVDDAGHWFLLRVSPLTTQERQVEGAILSFHNLDAEKQNETLLRSYQAKEQGYHEVVQGILMLLNVQGNLLSMNKSGCELLGVDEADLVGKNWVEQYVPKEHRAMARTFFEQTVEGTLLEEFECPVVTNGGEERIISWRTALQKDQNGNVAGIVCSGEDLTLLRQLNAALQKSEERFHLMMESVREDEFFIMDPEGYIVTWIGLHDAGKSYRAAEMVGRHFSSLFVPEEFQSGKPMHILERAAEEGRYEEDGWRMRKDGKRTRAYVIILPIRDDAKNLLGYSNVTRYAREQNGALKLRELNSPAPAWSAALQELR